MSAPISASAQVRDIRLDLSDSCNCGCRKPKPTMPVYVHEDGRVTPFSLRKAGKSIYATHAKSHDNLNRAIGEMARDRLIDLTQVWEESARRGIHLNRDMPLMMQTVRDLLQIIEEVSTPK